MPILRSPPFPAATAAAAAISEPADDLAELLRRQSLLAPDAARAERAHALRAAIVARRVGGACWALPILDLPVDPTIFCPSSLADARTMAALACEAGAGGQIALLPAAPWRHSAARLFRRQGIQVHPRDRDPWSVLPGARRVHAHGDDEIVLLALAAGIPVSLCADGAFGGWGLTDDAPHIPARGRLDLAGLIDAVLVQATRYRDCFTNIAASAEDAVAQLGAWRDGIDANRGIVAACGIARWKRREIQAFLWAPRAVPLRFPRRTATAVGIAAERGGSIAVWPSRAPAGLDAAAAAAAVPVRQVEDGFIRSVGLGSGLHPPLSIVVDGHGIYYDPAQPSDLEMLLADTRFTPALLTRAQRLIDTIVAAGIGKYGRGRGRYADLPANGRRVLVTGQVEDDRSVRLGGGGLTGNLDLLRRVRAAEPDAFLLFKPHPDVEAGHRQGRVADAEALRFADRIVRDATLPALLDAVDAVHVWTSLAGFEALLRGREVVTHGQPFFAGWGLTRDLGPPVARRRRRLSVPELVAGALILYPRYLDPIARLPCTPEILIERLARSSGSPRTLLTGVRQLQGRLRLKLAGGGA